MTASPKNNRSGCYSRAHVALFLRSRLWLGAPVAALLAFVATFLLRCLGDGKPVGDSLRVGAIFAAVAVFTWGLGVWAATDPSEEAEETAREETPPAPPVSRLRLLGRRVLFVALLLGALALVFASQIEGLVTGEVSLAKFFAGIALKFICIGSTLIPVWIAQRTRS